MKHLQTTFPPSIGARQNLAARQQFGGKAIYGNVFDPCADDARAEQHQCCCDGEKAMLAGGRSCCCDKRKTTANQGCCCDRGATDGAEPGIGRPIRAGRSCFFAAFLVMLLVVAVGLPLLGAVLAARARGYSIQEVALTMDKRHKMAGRAVYASAEPAQVQPIKGQPAHESIAAATAFTPKPRPTITGLPANIMRDFEETEKKANAEGTPTIQTKANDRVVSVSVLTALVGIYEADPDAIVSMFNDEHVASSSSFEEPTLINASASATPHPASSDEQDEPQPGPIKTLKNLFLAEVTHASEPAVQAALRPAAAARPDLDVLAAILSFDGACEEGEAPGANFEDDPVVGSGCILIVTSRARAHLFIRRDRPGMRMAGVAVFREADYPLELYGRNGRHLGSVVAGEPFPDGSMPRGVAFI